MNHGWIPDTATKDRQSVTSEWQPVQQGLIDGVRLVEVRNMLKPGQITTEVFRRDWFREQPVVDQIFQSLLNPGRISAWHAHEETTDRIFVNLGVMKVVLFDMREGSPTRGKFNEFEIGLLRPFLVIVPPKVWHGIQNTSDALAGVLNSPDRAYHYENPDHWRLPAETTSIPYRWSQKDSPASQPIRERGR